MADALIALHFQNDICHPEGRISFSLNRRSERGVVVPGGKPAQCWKRRAGTGWTIIHVHIAFAEDYSDLPRNCRLFSAVEDLGAVKRGSWGAAPLAAFEPAAGRDGDHPHLQQRISQYGTGGSSPGAGHPSVFM